MLGVALLYCYAEGYFVGHYAECRSAMKMNFWGTKLDTFSALNKTVFSNETQQLTAKV